MFILVLSVVMSFSLSKLRAISCEVLQVDSQAAIHTSLLHSTKRVDCKSLVGINALIETTNSKFAVVIRRVNKPSSLESVRLQRSVNSWSKRDWLLFVTHNDLSFFASDGSCDNTFGL